MKILIGIQARTGSKRFPGKIYKPLQGKPLLQWSYDAVKGLASDNVIVKVLGPKDDLELKTFCAANLISASFPDVLENDLFDRYLIAAKEVGADAVVRLTADCGHLTNASIVSDIIKALDRGIDYVSNTIVRTFVEGLDCQGSSVRALRWISGRQENREHPFFDFDHNMRLRDQFVSDGLKYEMLLNPGMGFLIGGGSIDTEEDLNRWNKAMNERGAPFSQ